jgi:5-methylcytosine-specific restriction endonuclease McrA
VPLTEQELRENKRQQDAAYYARNKERIIQRAGQYQKDNRERVNAKNLRWYKSHRELYNKAAKRFYQRHPEKLKARALDYYHTKSKFDPAYKARKKITRKQWGLRHPNYGNEYYAKYKLTPNGKAKIRAASMKRRALKKAATINLAAITEWIKRIKSMASSVCYYCERRIPSSEIHIDHIVALAKGGAHSVENLCVSCNHCNASKGAKPVRAWIRIGQQLLEL